MYLRCSIQQGTVMRRAADGFLQATVSKFACLLADNKHMLPSTDIDEAVSIKEDNFQREGTKPAHYTISTE